MSVEPYRFLSGCQSDRKPSQRLHVATRATIRQPRKLHLLQATHVHSHHKGTRFILSAGTWMVLQRLTRPFFFAGVKRNWRHGPWCRGPEAGEEAHRYRGGRGGGSWRAGGENFSKLPKEEEKTLDEFPEQFFLWLHSHQRGVLVQPGCLESFTERWKSLNTL